MTKVVVICSSPKKGEGSCVLCKEFAKSAIEAGKDVKEYYLADIEFEPCMECMECETAGKCVQDDGISEILDDMVEADVIVYANPIYAVPIHKNLKNLFERCKPIIGKLGGKDYYIIASNDPSKDSALNGIREFIELSKNPRIIEEFLIELLGTQLELLYRVISAGKNC